LRRALRITYLYAILSDRFPHSEAGDGSILSSDIDKSIISRNSFSQDHGDI
jgi:hypothetical protein